ncbi:MAG: hypothetical protein ACM3VT_19630, partial [Solirubrobacterales bacterium]
MMPDTGRRPSVWKTGSSPYNAARTGTSHTRRRHDFSDLPSLNQDSTIPYDIGGIGDFNEMTGGIIAASLTAGPGGRSLQIPVPAAIMAAMAKNPSDKEKQMPAA